MRTLRLSAMTPLHWALAVSVAAHALLLALRFTDPQALARLFEDAPLEVVLVNARSAQPPQKAQALAQHTLAGGGESERGRATSPLPAAALEAEGDAQEDARRQIEQLQQQQQQMLARLRQELARLPQPDPARSAGDASARAQEEHRQRLLRQLAEIERRIAEENARPRKRYVSPATREAVYALYYDMLRQRIERRGTQDFPTAQGRKLYGELSMSITVDALGRVAQTQVLRSSGNRLLDQRAQAIVRAAAPFEAFGNELRAQADLLVITARFRFTREDGLETTLSNR